MSEINFKELSSGNILLPEWASSLSQLYSVVGLKPVRIQLSEESFQRLRDGERWLREFRKEDFGSLSLDFAPGHLCAVQLSPEGEGAEITLEPTT